MRSGKVEVTKAPSRLCKANLYKRWLELCRKMEMLYARPPSEGKLYSEVKVIFARCESILLTLILKYIANNLTLFIGCSLRLKSKRIKRQRSWWRKHLRASVVEPGSKNPWSRTCLKSISQLMLMFASGDMGFEKINSHFRHRFVHLVAHCTGCCSWSSSSSSSSVSSSQRDSLSIWNIMHSFCSQNAPSLEPFPA